MSLSGFLENNLKRNLVNWPLPMSHNIFFFLLIYAINTIQILAFYKIVCQVDYKIEVLIIHTLVTPTSTDQKETATPTFLLCLEELFKRGLLCILT